jgi:hypothetical protein
MSISVLCGIARSRPVVWLERCGQWACARHAEVQAVGQTEARQPKSGQTTTGRSALPGHGDGKLTTFVPSVDDSPQSCGGDRS